MPKPKSEETKKHGDPLEPLIERTEASGGPGNRGDEDEDPAELEDDEDVENDITDELEDDDELDDRNAAPADELPARQLRSLTAYRMMRIAPRRRWH